MTKFVIRSMTTTDYDPLNARTPKPFHIYLMPEHKRTRAYWSGPYDALQFDTAEAAYAEIAKLGLARRCPPEVVPAQDGDVPAFWDRTAADRRADLAAHGVTCSDQF